MEEKGVVAITGARGRVAPLLAGAFRERGHKVRLYSRTGGVTEQGLEVRPLEELVRGEAEATEIIHCGWSTLPLTAEGAGELDSRRDIELVEALVGANPRARFVFLSTAAVYGNTGEEPVGEESETRPLGAYARWKLAAEGVFAARAGERSLILRVSNLVGCVKDASRPQGVLPRLVACARSGEEFVVWAPTGGRKDYLDTRDFLDAAVRLVEGGEVGIFNVASGRSWALEELVAVVEAVCDRRVRLRRQEPYAWDVRTSHISAEKLMGRTGWRPRFGLAESVRSVVEVEG